MFIFTIMYANGYQLAQDVGANGTYLGILGGSGLIRDQLFAKLICNNMDTNNLGPRCHMGLI